MLCASLGGLWRGMGSEDWGKSLFNGGGKLRGKEIMLRVLTGQGGD
ncbi:hypothetical protein MNL01_06985 [Bartonella krasnovii]|nr:hypothetical protein [Bartonella krasnovii]UNF35175.1 hypothetical protein MNL12_06195 [Bartonella krasnovii]UNF36793.1 hypothetical protein MNL11_06835 [Bartonella krasnovii]UNF38484.1 hypothetical protein MNL10_07035 [Bartonella krasnovii]UNF40209.1 hypothetical protein MNL09_07100 [Bartonella krasnovii]UNF41870.1 hypothetical protein MNL08_06775 [Bartonella krasnovii]